MKSELTPDKHEHREFDPLIGVKAKTRWYPAARGGWLCGRKRVLGPKALESND